jgi:hypothetical protein
MLLSGGGISQRGRPEEHARQGSTLRRACVRCSNTCGTPTSSGDRLTCPARGRTRPARGSAGHGGLRNAWLRGHIRVSPTGVESGSSGTLLGRQPRLRGGGDGTRAVGSLQYAASKRWRGRRTAEIWYGGANAAVNWPIGRSIGYHRARDGRIVWCVPTNLMLLDIDARGRVLLTSNDARASLLARPPVRARSELNSGMDGARHLAGRPHTAAVEPGRY